MNVIAIRFLAFVLCLALASSARSATRSVMTNPKHIGFLDSANGTSVVSYRHEGQWGSIELPFLADHLSVGSEASTLLVTRSGEGVPRTLEIVRVYAGDNIVFSYEGAVRRVGLVPTGRWFYFQKEGSTLLELRDAATGLARWSIDDLDAEAQLFVPMSEDVLFILEPGSDLARLDLEKGTINTLPGTHDLEQVMVIDSERVAGIRNGDLAFFSSSSEPVVYRTPDGYFTLANAIPKGWAVVSTWRSGEIHIVSSDEGLLLRVPNSRPVEVNGQKIDIGQKYARLSLKPNGKLVLAESGSRQPKLVLSLRPVPRDGSARNVPSAGVREIGAGTRESMTVSRAQSLNEGEFVFWNGKEVGRHDSEMVGTRRVHSLEVRPLDD